MRQVDTQEYVSVLRELVEDGKEVSLIISGGSMVPFLCHRRDYIYFQKPNRELKKGDMVFYQRESGQYVMHRIYKKNPEGYYMVGDAQQEIEGPLQRDQIFALITKVRRKGKMVGPGDFWWVFFEKVWINMVPVRKLIMKIYGCIMSKKNREVY